MVEVIVIECFGCSCCRLYFVLSVRVILVLLEVVSLVLDSKKLSVLSGKMLCDYVDSGGLIVFIGLLVNVICRRGSGLRLDVLFVYVVVGSIMGMLMFWGVLGFWGI